LTVIRSETIDVRGTDDVVRVRQTVRSWAGECSFSLVDQTKIVTAASELARNTVVYGGGGTLTLERLEVDGKRGLRLTFADTGPGIANIERAMTDGFTSGNGLGLGLSGAKRLCNDFEIDSAPGKGTRVTIARWK
jgi:serine/threonine-protein kinase RsbT